MNRWSSIVLGVAAAGVAGWAATGLQGRGLEVGRDPAGLALHTQLGFVSTLALLLADLWILIFLGLAARALRRIEPAGEASRGATADARRVAWTGAVALSLVALQPALSSALYPDRLRPDAHLALGLASFLVELLFLVVALRALGRQSRRFAAPERAVSPLI